MEFNPIIDNLMLVGYLGTIGNKVRETVEVKFPGVKKNVAELFIIMVQ